VFFPNRMALYSGKWRVTETGWSTSIMKCPRKNSMLFAALVSQKSNMSARRSSDGSESIRKKWTKPSSRLMKTLISRGISSVPAEAPWFGSPWLLAQIFKRGRCVLQQDPESLSRFKTVSYSLIADFGYHRSLMERAFVSRITGDAP
jgi:hypothetical protein